MNFKNNLVSVIFAAYNEEKYTRTLLESIKNQTYLNIESIVVVDNKTTDNTLEVAKELSNIAFLGSSERSENRNLAVQKSSGRYILLLDADMKLSKEVVFECVQKIQSNEKIKAIIIPEQSFGEGYWAKCKALERNCYVGDDTIEAARFFEKSVYTKVGGYNENMVSGEDWDLSNRIRKAGYTISRVNSKIYHNEGNLSLIKTLKKKAYYAQKSTEYINDNVTSLKQVFLFVFRPAYFRNWKLFLNDPFHAVGFMIMKFLEITIGGFIIVRTKLIS